MQAAGTFSSFPPGHHRLLSAGHHPPPAATQPRPKQLGSAPVGPASLKPKLCFFSCFITVRRSGHWLCQETVVSRWIVFVVGRSRVQISSPGAAVCSVCGLGKLSERCCAAAFPSVGWGSDTCFAEGPNRSWDKQRCLTNEDNLLY